MMRLTDSEEASRIVAMDGVQAALRAQAEEGLPPARDAADAKALLEARLLRHGMDLRDAGSWLLFHLAAPEGGEDQRLAATRWAIDVHACVPRGHADTIEALQDGLRLVARQLRPSPGMEAYLAARAAELAALEAKRARAEPVRLRRLLVHAQSMDDADTVRLPFAVTLPASEVFEALREDGIALHRFGAGMGACPLYRTALQKSRNLVAGGVESGIHSLFGRPSSANIEPAAYVEHFRCVLDDGRWVDNVLTRLCADADASHSQRVRFHGAQWLAVLARIGGWNPSRLQRLLNREDLLADHPDEFVPAAMNAIHHIARRDAAAEVCAALKLLRMVQGWSDASPDREANLNVRRCLGWIARLRRGRDLLWLHDRLPRFPCDGPEASVPDEKWHTSIPRRVADDRALARGVLLFLMATRDQRVFILFIPLIEGVLSLRDEHRLLWKLARGEDKLLLRRAGMFLLGILGGRIRTDGRRIAPPQGSGLGARSPGRPEKSLSG